MIHAIRLNDLAKRGPFGKTKLYELIGQGLLRARKIGSTTFVTEDDWRSFLESAPLAGRRNQNQEPLAA